MADMMDNNLFYLAQKTVLDVLKAQAEDTRAGRTADLLTRYAEDGVKSVAVKLPDGTKVATFTLNEPKPRLEVPPEALLEFVSEHYPDLVETVEHPPVEAWTERVVPPSALKALGLKATDSGDVVTKNGEVIPGAHATRDDPSNFTVRYEGGDDGRERVIRAWQDGDLGHVIAARASILPALEGGKAETVPTAPAEDVVDAEVVEDTPTVREPWEDVPLPADVWAGPAATSGEVFEWER